MEHTQEQEHREYLENKIRIYHNGELIGVADCITRSVFNDRFYSDSSKVDDYWGLAMKIVRIELTLQSNKYEIIEV